MRRADSWTVGSRRRSPTPVSTASTASTGERLLAVGSRASAPVSAQKPEHAVHCPPHSRPHARRLHSADGLRPAPCGRRAGAAASWSPGAREPAVSGGINAHARRYASTTVPPLTNASATAAIRTRTGSTPSDRATAAQTPPRTRPWRGRCSRPSAGERARFRRSYRSPSPRTSVPAQGRKSRARGETPRRAAGGRDDPPPWSGLDEQSDHVAVRIGEQASNPTTSAHHRS